MPLFPQDLGYTQHHQWLRSAEPGVAAVATVGITDLAQDRLGPVVYVGIPKIGDRVTAGMVCGEVESSKSVNDIVSPVSGTVVSVNGQLDDEPTIINDSPYDEGWLFVVAVTETGTLLSAEQYEALA